MQKSASPKQVARAIGVGESTLKRWCDRGLIPMTKTVGGHRRIELDAVVRFLRETGREFVDPAVLGLPVSAGRTDWTLHRASERLVQALVNGEATVVRQAAFDLLLAGHNLTAIFDEAMAPAFHTIGERWSCGDVAVYQERRACEICMQCLHELRNSTPQPGSESPLAIGATTAADNYTIAVSMAELVLRSVGWQSRVLGTNLPFETLVQAVQDSRPRLVWLSVSHIAEEEPFILGLNELFAIAHSCDAVLAVGGQAFDPELRNRTQFNVYCESFRDLEMFARSLHSHDSTPTAPAADKNEQRPR